jgi:predicted transcriptional regulator
MLISHFVENVQSDLEGLGRLGGDQFEEFAGRLVQAAGPAIRARLLEALDQIVAEVNAGGDRRDLSVSMAGDEVSLVRAASADAPGELPGEFTARFALRLPEEIKAHVEQLAQQAGTSTNSWIVRALAREAADNAARSVQRSGRQLRGTGRS